MTRATPAVRFEARHSNACWQFDISPSDLKHIAQPAWVDPKRGQPTMMLYSVVDDRSGTSYQEYRCVYGEDAESTLRFLFNTMAPKEDTEFQGIPEMIYLDNGAVAKSLVFQTVTERLGVDWKTHMPAGSDGNRVTARSKGKVERPFRTVKEAHETLYHFHKPETEAGANLWLRNFISVIRAKIEKAMESHLRGPWRELQDEFITLLESLPKRSTGPEKLLNILDGFKALRERVETAFEAAFDWPEESDAVSTQQAAETSDKVVSISQNMIPTGIEDETHILTTNEPHPVKSNRFETKHAADVVPEMPTPAPFDGSNKVDLDITWDANSRKRTSEVDVPMLMASCPQFAEMARGSQGYLRDWNDVHRAAASLRPMVGISEDAWNVANRVMGPAIAAASVALIYDKLADGVVKSPGGYLRGLVERAQAGELHLDRSFYGRLSETRV